MSVPKQPRNTIGQYSNKKPKSKFKAFMYICFLLVIVLLIIRSDDIFSNKMEYKADDEPKVVNIIDENQSEINKIKDRENFKNRIENQAKQVFLQEKIANVNQKIEDLKVEKASIEDELEKARLEELSFQ